jgi:MOSC domain-containing protein YiiM
LTGKILAICVSERKGTAKHSTLCAQLQKDHGLVGDAHAGPGHRQVSLLADTDVENMRHHDLELPPGAFGENLLVEGIDLGILGIG